MKRRLLLVFVLSFIFIACMTVSSFAANKPVGLEYSGVEIVYDKTNPDYTDGLSVDGNSITIRYSDGSSKKYVCKCINDEYSWYLNGNKNAETADFRENFDSSSAELTVSYDEEVYDDTSDDSESVEVSTKIKAKALPIPVSFDYQGKALEFEPNDDYVRYLDKAGNKLVVTYDDGSTKTFICKKYKDNGGYSYNYFLNGQISKRIDGEYDYVVLSQKNWKKMPVTTTEVDINYQENVGPYNDTFWHELDQKVPIRLNIPAYVYIKNMNMKYNRVVVIKWNKLTKYNASGYQIQVSTKKNFSGAKTLTIKSKATTSKKLPKASKGKKYYVRIRSIHNISGKTTYSKWSASFDYKYV